MFFGGNFWSCGRRGDGRGIAPTFRRLHLMHRDVGLWKSRRLPPLPGPPGHGYSGRLLLPAQSPARLPCCRNLLAIPSVCACANFPALSLFCDIRMQLSVTLHPTPVRIPGLSYNSRNPLNVILPAVFEEQAKGCGLVPVERAVVFVAEKAAGTWHGDFITNKISKSL